MNTEQRIDAICEFLREHVAPELMMKKPNDDDELQVKMVSPEVYPTYLPPIDSGKDWKSLAPCLVVMPLKDSRDRGEGILSVRVGVMTWSPGTRQVEDEKMTLVYDRDGWRTLYTVMDMVESTLSAYHSIGDMSVEYPIVKTHYEEGSPVPDTQPYYLGQIDVPMNYILPVRLSPELNKLLE